MIPPCQNEWMIAGCDSSCTLRLRTNLQISLHLVLEFVNNLELGDGL